MAYIIGYINRLSKKYRMTKEYVECLLKKQAYSNVSRIVILDKFFYNYNL